MNIKIVLDFLAFVVIYSFLGWLLETTAKSLTQKQFVNSGFLYGPICPIYGFAAVIMIICLSFLKDKPLLLFVVSFVVLSVWEYVVGVFLEKAFKTKYWDYSRYKYNIHGRVCLQNSIIWGLLGVFFIRYIHPFIAEKIEMIPQNIMLYMVIGVYIVIMIDAITTIIKTVKFDDAIKKVNELGEKIKLNIEMIKKNGLSASAKEKAEKLIRELKIKETRLKIRLYRNAKRLKLAFPTMKSETITNFLNQKIDFETLKKLMKNKNKE